MLTLVTFFVQAQADCVVPTKVAPTQSIEPEQALEQYYRDRKRGLLYGHEESLKKAIQYFYKHDDKEKLFHLFNALADYYIFHKKTADAEKILLESKKIAQQEDNKQWLAAVLILKANIELSLNKENRWESNPLGIYQQALELAKIKNKSDSLLVVQITNNILFGQFILEREKKTFQTENNKLFSHSVFSDAEIEQLYNQQFTSIKSLFSTSNKVSLIAKQALKFGFLAINHTAVNIRNKGEEMLKSVIEKLENVPEDESYAYAHGYLAEYYFNKIQIDKKISTLPNIKTHLELAIFFTRQQKTPVTLLYYWYWQLAKYHLQQDDIEQAKKMYKIAIKYLKPVRRAIFNTFPSYQTKFLPQKDNDLFKEYADLLLKQAALLAEGDEKQTILLAALNSIEQLQATKLQNYFEDECVADLTQEITVKTLPNIPATAIAYYPIIFNDRIVLLLARINKQKQSIYITQHVVKKEKVEEILENSLRFKSFEELRDVVSYNPQATLANKVNLLLEKYADMAKDYKKAQRSRHWFNSDYLAINRGVFRILIEPVWDDIKKFDVLIIISTGKLALVPFAALYSNETTLTELIRDLAVVNIINLSLVDFTDAPNIKKFFLFAGLSTVKDGYQHLEYVKDLHNALASKQFRGMLRKKYLSLLDEHFTYNKLKAILLQHEYGIVHIATHAEFGATPLNRFLVTSEKNILIENLENLMISKIHKLNLLVLSACNTATGDENAIWGLAGVAIKARVSTVLGSLWEVQEQTTSELMQLFYKDLLDSKIGIGAKAVAWQQAQLNYLDSQRKPTKKHPYYWAGFILIGSL